MPVKNAYVQAFIGVGKVAPPSSSTTFCTGRRPLPPSSTGLRTGSPPNLIPLCRDCHHKATFSGI